MQLYDDLLEGAMTVRWTGDGSLGGILRMVSTLSAKWAPYECA